ncbi:LlaJI family restriction endonuclease [Caproicibacter sp.]|uniref:LlaJI family restriction endonuclease n=1 Tax=Caproicibacter sp. TaxID=2814884 RepID=UPI003988B58B
MENLFQSRNAEMVNRILPNIDSDMDKRGITLREMCHVNKNGEGDSFVGVKADTNGMTIYFPIGYELPENDDDLRVDVHNLFGVLAIFMKEASQIETQNFSGPISVDFPMHAYIKVIRHYLNTGRYYIETEPEYVTATKGAPDWPRTFKNQMGLVQKNGSVIFTQMTVRRQSPNTNKKITQIHQYCVHEAFSKLGTIYVSFVPQEPAQHPGIAESISILTDKINHTNKDVERNLFKAMRQILTYIDTRNDNNRFFFGTDRFEYVWQNMIDAAFGISDKGKYFPKATWLLDKGPASRRKRTSLQPDSIMIYGGKYYVLDAKCYRYGWSENPDHLPGGPDINKQITYGEYIEQTRTIPNEQLFNAFILPYNCKENLFNLTGVIENIGEAVGDWRYDPSNPHMKNYERVQGIVVDTRYLMYNYIGTPDEQKKELAECIERVLSRPGITQAMLV